MFEIMKTTIYNIDYRPKPNSLNWHFSIFGNINSGKTSSLLEETHDKCILQHDKNNMIPENKLRKLSNNCCFTKKSYDKIL